MENIGETHPSTGAISSHGAQAPEYQVHYPTLSAPQTGKGPERIKWECRSRQVLPNVPQLLWSLVSANRISVRNVLLENRMKQQNEPERNYMKHTLCGRGLTFFPNPAV
jgi:hypothetical protein